jgi:hypothetical protein
MGWRWSRGSNFKLVTGPFGSVARGGRARPALGTRWHCGPFGSRGTTPSGAFGIGISALRPVTGLGLELELELER